MLNTVVSLILAYIALVLAVSTVGLAWSGVLLKKDNLLEGLVPHLRRIKNKSIRNLLQCHKCVSGQFALWSFGIAWAWYAPAFNPLILFLWVAWVMSVIIVTDWLYLALKLDLKPGVPIEEQVETIIVAADTTPPPAEKKTPMDAVRGYVTLDNLRRRKNHELITEGVIHPSKPLKYFVYNKEAVVLGDITACPSGTTAELATTSGATREEILFGSIFFTFHGHLCGLKAYRVGESLLVPFKDTAEEVSAKGRYLEVPLPATLTDMQVKLDFNKAFNPLCEYSDKFDCIVVPTENYLNFPIEAGEKAYT